MRNFENRAPGKQSWV